MRMIETFTSFELIKRYAPDEIDQQEIIIFSKCIFSYMIDQNYYSNVRKMLNEKINDSDYIEVTTKPATVISEVILDMIKRPLKLISDLSVDKEFDSKILAAFVNEILANDSNHTISNFIIPSLASDNFPFIKLINFLYDIHVKRHLTDNNHGEENETFRDIKFNGYLLHAILHLDVNFLNEIENRNYLQQYLIVIGSMIGCIIKLPRSNEYTKFSNFEDNDESTREESDDDDDDEDDEEMQPQFERLILMDIIKELNDQNRVNRIVRNIDSILHIPKVIHSICVIAHNLMIYNRAAISEYR